MTLPKFQKPQALSRRILAATLFSSVVVLLCFLAVIYCSDTMTALDESAVDLFQNTVEDRGRSLSQHLTQWSDLEQYYTALTKALEQSAKEAGQPISQLLKCKGGRRAFLSRSMGQLVACLDEKEASNAFLILENGQFRKEGLFLMDPTPGAVRPDWQDLYALAGPSELILPSGITMDSNWSTLLPESTSSQPFYAAVTEVGGSYPRIEGKYLGYFSPGNTLLKKEDTFISFSLPLLDENHQTIGVFGIGITLTDLRTHFQDPTLGLDPEGVGVIAVTEDGRTFQNVLANGGPLAEALPNGASFSYDKLDTKSGLRHFSQGVFSQEYDFYYHPCTVYLTNTPFASQQWLVGYFLHHDALHAASQQLHSGLVIAVLVALMLSIVTSVLIAKLMTRPLDQILAGISQLSASNITLPDTGVTEFDMMSQALVKQTKEIYHASSRLADIIKLSDMAISVLEYDETKEEQLCTQELFQMFDMDMEGWKDNYISKEKLFPRMEHLRGSFFPVPEESKVYRYLSPSGQEKYIHLARKEEEHRGLCLFIDVTETTKEKLRIRHERDFDVLTDLYNRRAFYTKVRRLFEEGRLRTAMLSIWDLDNLKYVNDTFGHELGDAYIQSLSSSLLDVQGNCICARRSGDEFLVFLYNEEVEEMYTKLRTAHQAFQRKRLTLPSGREFPVGVSVGIATLHLHADTLQTLEEYADFAMYEAKKDTKGTIHVFNAQHFQRDAILINSIGELNRIISETSVRYAFQPIISVKEGRVVAYEALLNPISEEVTNASDLIRLAESQSKLSHIERFAWMCGLKDFYQAFPQQAEETLLFIKSLPNQCLNDRELAQLEETYGSRLSRVVVEMTEHARVNRELARKKIDWCAQWGISLALDDYGSGYSNNDMLVSQDYRYVRFSTQMVREIHKKPEVQELVRTLILFCHQNGQMVIAECVETVEEMETLIHLGADLLQGNLFAKASFLPQAVNLSVLPGGSPAGAGE